MSRRWRLTRRGFLIGGGLTGAGIALGWRFGVPRLHLGVADALEGAAPLASLPITPDAWFTLAGDGTVTLALPKVEMGQGIHTALAQIAADELEIAWEQIRVVQASTRAGLADSGGTGASNSVRSAYLPLRTAAATLREMLRAAAMAKLGAAAITIREGVCYDAADPQRSVTYGALAAERRAWKVPQQPIPLKSPDTFTIVGSAAQRLDIPAKLEARAVYGFDARADGMAYGAAAHPPTLGAMLRRAAPGSAASVPGVLHVVIEDGFAGVVATSRAAASAGVRELELVWDERPPLQQSEIDARIQVGRGDGVTVQQIGDAVGALSTGGFGTSEQPAGGLVSAEYRTPMAAHAHLEPQAALVTVTDAQVTALVSTQSPDLVRDELARLLGRKPETVEVTATYLGGGFGRRLNVEVAGEAARLARGSGMPVHVGWSRTDEFRHGYHRPPTHHALRAALAADGTIAAIEHQQASGEVAFPFLPAAALPFIGADFGAWRGARIVYESPNRRTVAWLNKLPVRTGWWRGLGLLANTFAIESFVDELAHAAGADPLAFRLAHLGDDPIGRRLAQVLQVAADRAGWHTPFAAGRGRGIACSFDAGTAVAHVAEVSLGERGIRVHRVTCAVDPGLVINPDGVVAQCEGAIMMGVSSTLFERLTVADGQFAPSNFDGYPLLRIGDAPAIDVAIVGGGDTPYGMGEPPLGPTAAAIANAVFALSGQRLRELPLAPKL